MTSLLKLARTLRTRDDGVALPTVFGLALLMLVLVASAMTVSTRGIVKTSTDEDTTGALAAAYAGVEEYQSRLANDSNYQKFGNPAAPFSLSSASSLSLPTGANANPAFGIGTSGTWANIPGEPLPDGTSQQSPGWFRYEVSNVDYADKGVLHLRVTGKVGEVTRSIVADLRDLRPRLLGEQLGRLQQLRALRVCIRFDPGAQHQRLPADPVRLERRVQGPGAQQRPALHLRDDLREGRHLLEPDQSDLEERRMRLAGLPGRVTGVRGTHRDAADEQRDEEGGPQ
jgi:hypothetical protein